jgi:hypothetical protein
MVIGTGRRAGVFFVALCILSLVAGSALPGVVLSPTEKVSEFTPDFSDTGRMSGSEFGSDGNDSGAEGEEDVENSPDEDDDRPNERGTSRGKPSFGIRTSDPLIPGQYVTITVIQSGAPVDRVLVGVNDQTLGRTDQFGQIDVSVPYAERFAVVAQKPAIRDRSSIEATTATEDGDGGLIQMTTTTQTNAQIVPLREPRPGETLTTLVHIDGVPVEGADVRQSGQLVGQTDENGTVSVDIPWERSTELTVERGEVTAERNLTIGPLEMSTMTAGQLVVAAGQPLAIIVHQDDRPVSGATVRIDGTPVGTTNSGGEFTTRLPHASEATIEVSKGSLSAQQTLTGLYSPYINLLLVLGGAVLLLGLTVVQRRRLASTAGVGASLMSRLSRAVVYAAVRLSRGAAHFVGRLSRGARYSVRMLSAISHLLSALPNVIRGAFGRLRRRELIPALRDLVAGWLAFLRSLVGQVPRSIHEVAGQERQRANDDLGTTAGGITDTDEAERYTIREAFQLVASAVPPPRRTLTPEEIAHRAIDRGLPPEDVRTIVDAFRDVVYGRRDPQSVGERVAQAATKVSESVNVDCGGREE